MDRFIPIIIMIVIFAVRAYANYQKEQEKARKRNPGVPPPLPEDNARHVKPVPVPVPVPPSTTVQPVSREFDSYSGPVSPVEEIRRPRRGRTPTPKRLAVEATDTEEKPAMEAGQFDLRDAVIKSIILDRPYK